MSDEQQSLECARVLLITLHSSLGVKDYGKARYSNGEASDSGGESHSRAARGAGLGPARSQHHGLLQIL